MSIFSLNVNDYEQIYSFYLSGYVHQPTVHQLPMVPPNHPGAPIRRLEPPPRTRSERSLSWADPAARNEQRWAGTGPWWEKICWWVVKNSWLKSDFITSNGREWMIIFVNNGWKMIPGYIGTFGYSENRGTPQASPSGYPIASESDGVMEPQIQICNTRGAPSGYHQIMMHSFLLLVIGYISG